MPHDTHDDLPSAFPSSRPPQPNLGDEWEYDRRPAPKPQPDAAAPAASAVSAGPGYEELVRAPAGSTVRFVGTRHSTFEDAAGGEEGAERSVTKHENGHWYDGSRPVSTSAGLAFQVQHEYILAARLELPTGTPASALATGSDAQARPLQVGDRVLVGPDPRITISGTDRTVPAGVTVGDLATVVGFDHTGDVLLDVDGQSGTRVVRPADLQRAPSEPELSTLQKLLLGTERELAEAQKSERQAQAAWAAADAKNRKAHTLMSLHRAVVKLAEEGVLAQAEIVAVLRDLIAAVEAVPRSVTVTTNDMNQQEETR